ncbi:fibronectin type III domain-containing protein [Candidatus Micrarchaeota archaeon]|nr:fibronectin type III domain-containing protein [Candidatus Micrarchaeota archaeon]
MDSDDWQQWLLVLTFIVLGGIIISLYYLGKSAPDYPPSPPTDVYAFQNGSVVFIRWTPSISGDVIGYNVYRSTKKGVLGERVNNRVINGSSYTDTFYLPEGQYFYTVRAVDRSNEEDNLNQVSVNIDRTPPTDCEIQISRPVVKVPQVLVFMTCEDAYFCRFKDDGHEWSQFFPYTQYFTVPLYNESGERKLYGQCMDNHGNLGSIVYSVVTIDDHPPEIDEVVGLTSGFYHVGGNASLVFNVSDDYSKEVRCTLYINDIPVKDEETNTGSTILFNISFKERGPYIISLQCSDVAGNIARWVDVARVIE